MRALLLVLLLSGCVSHPYPFKQQADDPTGYSRTPTYCHAPPDYHGIIHYSHGGHEKRCKR